MLITRTVENSLRNVDPTPLYAVVGAGDRLVAMLRDAREEVQARGGAHGTDHSWDLRTLPAALQAAAARLETVTGEVRARTSDAKTLPDQATDLLTGAVAQAIMTYAELAHRGKDVVAHVRGGQETPTSAGMSTSGTATTGTSTTGTSTTGTSTTADSPDTPPATRTASRGTRAAKKPAASTTKRAKSATTTQKGSASAKTTSKEPGETTGS